MIVTRPTFTPTDGTVARTASRGRRDRGDVRAPAEMRHAGRPVARGADRRRRGRHVVASPQKNDARNPMPAATTRPRALTASLRGSDARGPQMQKHNPLHGPRWRRRRHEARADGRGRVPRRSRGADAKFARTREEDALQPWPRGGGVRQRSRPSERSSRPGSWQESRAASEAAGAAR